MLFVESFPGFFQFLIHSEQLFDPRVLFRVFADEEDDVLDLNATGSTDVHRLVSSFRDELYQQVLQHIDGFWWRKIK